VFRLRIVKKNVEGGALGGEGEKEKESKSRRKGVSQEEIEEGTLSTQMELTWEKVGGRKFGNERRDWGETKRGQRGICCLRANRGATHGKEGGEYRDGNIGGLTIVGVGGERGG